MVNPFSGIGIVIFEDHIARRFRAEGVLVKQVYEVVADEAEFGERLSISMDAYCWEMSSFPSMAIESPTMTICIMFSMTRILEIPWKSYFSRMGRKRLN